MMVKIDGDKSRRIDFNEFLELYSRKVEDPDTEDDLIEGFKLFDKNCKISPNELKSLLIDLLPNLSGEEAEEIFRDADRNSDIDFKEFVKYILSK